MKVLVIGGTGFIGSATAAELSRTGHEVAIFHRGKSKTQVPPIAQSILGDARNLAEHRSEISRFAPDIVLNFILSSGKQADAFVRVIRNIADRDRKSTRLNSS